MNTKEQLKKDEKRLLDTIYEILDYYNYQRMSFDPSDISAGMVVSEIKKNISRLRIETRIEILGSIITTINDGILESDGTRFIFHNAIDQSLREIADRKKVISVAKEDKKEQINKENEEKILKQIPYLLNMFDVADREMMISLETDINKKIMGVTAWFGIPHGGANIDVISRLNSGMYGKNQSQLISELKESGIKTSKSTKVSAVMSDELFKYRLTALLLTLNACEINKDNIKPKTYTSHYNRGEYNKLLEKVKLIGKTVAKAYEREYGMTPKQALFEDPYDKKYEQMLKDSQMMLDEFLLDDEIKVKDIRRDKK